MLKYGHGCHCIARFHDILWVAYFMVMRVFEQRSHTSIHKCSKCEPFIRQLINYRYVVDIIEHEGNDRQSKTQE